MPRENRVEKSRVHFSCQAQYLVKLECDFSWQAQHLVTFWEIAGARNVVFFNTYGLRVFCVGNGGFLRRWVGWGVFCDGRCWGFFATVPGFFFATVAGFLATARRVICISGGFLRR